MAPSSVLVGLDEFDDGALDIGSGSEGRPVSVAKNNSAAALPVRRPRQAHIVGLRPFDQRPAGVLGAPIAVDIAFPGTLLHDLADSSTVAAMPTVIRSESDQPTTMPCAG